VTSAEPAPPVEKPEPEISTMNEVSITEERVPLDEVVVIEDTAYHSLFEFSGQGDLSDRLSQRPIENILGAMGVNERIFMMNELFGGDKSAFENHVQALNNSSDFNSAKHYLIDQVIPQYGWINDDKENQAKDFIKLVRRLHA